MALKNSVILPICKAIAARARARRLGLNISQQEVSARTGLSTSTIKRFEASGEIAFSGLVAICGSLGCARELAALFPPATQPADRHGKSPRKRASKHYG